MRSDLRLLFGKASWLGVFLLLLHAVAGCGEDKSAVADPLLAEARADAQRAEEDEAKFGASRRLAAAEAEIELGRWESAQNLATEIIVRFPDSAEVTRAKEISALYARQKMERESLAASKLLAESESELKGRSWREAKRLSEEILEDYPSSPQAVRAHAIIKLAAPRLDAEVQARVAKITREQATTGSGSPLTARGSLTSWKKASSTEKARLSRELARGAANPNASASYMISCVNEVAEEGALGSQTIAEVASACAILADNY